MPKEVRWEKMKTLSREFLEKKTTNFKYQRCKTRIIKYSKIWLAETQKIP
jgi:hypothetical protein